jgi:hypothetical protein
LLLGAAYIAGLVAPLVPLLCSPVVSAGAPDRRLTLRLGSYEAHAASPRRHLFASAFSSLGSR